MTEHKFRLGQHVTFVGPTLMRGRGEGYDITALLPVERGEAHYRVRRRAPPLELVSGRAQPLDRVLAEYQILAVPVAAA
jgi:hypothetical protein